jgi:hypothetical protein
MRINSGWPQADESMITPTELRDLVWNAMDSLPKPVAKEAALTAALEVLTGKEATQFSNWWEKNADYVMEKLNDG